MTDSLLTYRIALSMMKGVTPDIIRCAADRGLTLSDFFTLPTTEVSDAIGLRGASRLQQTYREESIANATAEARFITSHNIHVTALTEDDYPMSLAEIERAPLTLYSLGDCPLTDRHMLSIVGTRRCTPAGVAFVRNIVNELAHYFPDLIIVSGLAYGIDHEAHESAIANNLRTIAVVAHGLDMVYPASHRDLAARIVRSGGAIITEYPSRTRPLQGRFLERNRIVATLPQGVFVAESDIKGGAMSTANTAASYSRDVMALPGRVTDEASRGCNRLIATNKARLVSSTADIMECLGWQPDGMCIDLRQRNLFPELDGDTKRIYEMLRYERVPVTTDTIHVRLGIPIHILSALLSEMEFDGLVLRHPGNRYEIAT